MHPQRVSVWCGIQIGGMSGPFFFGNVEGAAVIVNAGPQQVVLRDYLFPNIEYA